MIAFVIPWLMLSRTGSAWNAGMVAFAMRLASLVGILMGGLIIDRMGGRKMSVVANGLSFVTAAALGIALSIDFLPLWFVIISQVFGVLFNGPGTITDVANLNGSDSQAIAPGRCLFPSPEGSLAAYTKDHG